MIRGFLILGLLALLPWWVSWGLDRLGVRIPIAPFAAWVKDPPEEPPAGPPPDWREDRYLAANPDVAAAVRKGALSSGYAHYVAFGQAERRTGGFGTPAPAAVPPQPAPQPPPHTMAAGPSPEPPPPPPAAPSSTPMPLSMPAPVTVAAPAVPPVAVAAARPLPVPLPPAKPPVPAAAGPAGPPPSAGRISAIRVGTHQGFTRIVLDVDTPLRLERPAGAATRSVGVDLPNAVWRTERQGQLIARTLAYRVEESASGTSRLTLNAETPIQVKSLFLLPPEGERRHRVVLDVVRADTGGPLPARR